LQVISTNYIPESIKILIMKTIYILIITGCFILAPVRAQNEMDALRYSQNFFGGSARSIAMGGAFGALGGDFSSASLNPAGIGVYRSNELTVSPGLIFDNTSTGYLGNTRTDNRYQFTLNNLGYIFSHQTGKDNGWVGYSFGIGYNQLNNFNRNTLMEGIMLSGGSESSSYLDNFTNNANADNWSEFYEELAWLTNLMPFDTLDNVYWNDIMEAGYGQSQLRRIQEKGSMGETALTFGANYGNRLYFGATFGIHRMRYSNYTDHTEIDDARIIDYFNSFTFRETLETRGTGYTFKAGFIFRPISLIRIGAAFHIPTFYRIREDFYTDMSSTFDENTGEPDYFERSPVNQFEYWLRTPYRAIGSVAFQVGKVAMIGVDYEFMDYRQANMDSRVSDYNLLDVNDRIQNVYSVAHNLRAGAEFHLGPMYLRAGAAFYDSPFNSREVNAEAWNLIYSGGFGFRSQRIFFDMAYAYRTNDYRYYLYIPEDVHGAAISSNKQNFIATLGFRF
jgi:hypothetical protein